MDSAIEKTLVIASIAFLAGCAAIEGPTSAPGYPPISAAEGRALVSRLLPDGLKDRAGWATDIYAAFAALDIPPTPENICAAIAVTGRSRVSRSTRWFRARENRARRDRQAPR
jgi:hypothetical protein